MKDEDYKPFYLNNIVEVSDGYYILNGWPQYNYNEDLYYEIHIESNDSLKIIKHYVDDWIYVDLISSNELEIYTGWHIQECFSGGPSSYTYYSYKEIEKTSKGEWKPRFKDLEIKFNALLNQRLPEYIITRNKVAQNFKQFYKQILPDNENTDKARIFIFGSLYGFPGHNLASEAYLHSLVNPNKELKLFEDWRFDYELLEAKYNNLLTIDLEDYSIIKKHVIDIYKNMYYHMLPNLKYSFNDAGEQKYTALFNTIIELTDKTDS